MQLAGPLYQGLPSTRILASNGVSAKALRPRPDVGGAAEPVLQPPSARGDHVGVEARPGHHGEALAVHRADVDRARLAVQPGRDGAVDVLRDPEVGREQVGRAGRDDRDRRARPGERVDAALRHAVSAPDEEVVGALLAAASDLLWRLLALRHLDPERVGNAVACERAAQFRQPALDALAGVGDHRNRAHGDAPRAARRLRRRRGLPPRRRACRCRPAAPAATSVGWCMPAVHAREGHEQRESRRRSPSRALRQRCCGSAGDEQCDAAVDGDRRSGVTRVVASVQPAGGRGGVRAAAGGG